jgi:hypothetical protein
LKTPKENPARIFSTVSWDSSSWIEDAVDAIWHKMQGTWHWSK